MGKTATTSVLKPIARLPADFPDMTPTDSKQIRPKGDAK